MDGDLAGDVLVRVIGEVRAERIRELDLAGLYELYYRHRGEHLVHGSDAKARVERVRDPPFAICQSVGAAEEDLAVLLDQHRAAELSRRGYPAQRGLDARDVFGFACRELRRVRCGLLVALACEPRK